LLSHISFAGKVGSKPSIKKNKEGILYGESERNIQGIMKYFYSLVNPNYAENHHLSLRT